MISRIGPSGPRRRGSAALLLLLLAGRARLYGALLVLYPEAFRRRYAAEMRRDFSELLREGLQEEDAVPHTPVSPKPLRNGLLTLVIGLILCAGAVVALPGVAATVAGKLGRPAVLQVVGEAGILAVPSSGPSVAEVLKEKELLEELLRRGKLTAVEAALETSLSVEEADRMLSELAVRGHLQVTVEHGRLHYALWERDAPL
jgi:hypothetical protein